MMKKVKLTEGMRHPCRVSLPEGVHLVEDRDFTENMRTENAAWREKCVHSGDFLSFDGTRIHYYYAIPENRRGNILMLHGFCEFWGKYHETARYFYEAGYGIFFPEQRGHGLSERLVREKDLVHVNTFDCYAEDVREFIRQVVSHLGGELPVDIFSHSMGGAVSALFLEKYPGCIRRAILSAPMIRLKTGGIPQPVLDAMAACVRLHRDEEKLSVGQSHFNGSPAFEGSGSLSRERYAYQFAQRLENEYYRTFGGTFGWVMAGLEITPVLLKNAHQIRIPMLIFQAGCDHLVESREQLVFARRAQNAVIVRYGLSRHEIFNATGKIREDYYRRIFAFLEAKP